MHAIDPEAGGTNDPCEGAAGDPREGAAHDPREGAAYDTRVDDALVARSRQGDAQALATLYRRYAPPLLDYLVRLLGDRADGEDLLHEVFLRLFAGRGRYEERGRFRAWLFTVATHLARDRLKQDRRRRELTADMADTLAPASPVDPLDQLGRRELLRMVESVLADLPPAYAMAFHLRVREEFSYREIAAICGEPEGTLRSRVHHTLKRIRLALPCEHGGTSARSGRTSGTRRRAQGHQERQEREERR